MTHPEDGALQAFLDDELPPPERAELAEHLLACDACRGAYDSLLRANGLFAQSVSVLDSDPPATRSAAERQRGRKRTGTGPFARAAVLMLVFAAAASAAVPGSPVREWIRSVGEPDPPAPTTEAPAPSVVTPPEPAAPAGVSVQPASGRVLVALRGLVGSTIELESVPGTEAAVAVRGADRDPSFRTGAGRLEVRDGTGGTVRVRLPADVDARLEVDGRLYAERTAGSLQLHVPADTVGGTLVWR